MLKARILTVIIILPLFLSALFFLQDIFWAIFLLSLTVIGAREWSRLAQLSVKNTILFMVFTVLVGGELLFQLGESIKADIYSTEFLWLYAISAIFWLTSAPLCLSQHLKVEHPLLWMLIGWVLLLPTCLALYQIRSINPLLLLTFMSTIWISDTAAYFTGRALGKHKLAPQISPNKTWEGVAGALIAVFIYALIWNLWFTHSFTMVYLVLLLMLMVVLGIIGDLYESLIKRQAGIKDSGNILPGHGGILDRIDALTASLPFAALAILIFHSSTP